MMQTTEGQLTRLYYICVMKEIAIIGAGAAGCFCAALLSGQHPEWSVSLYEAGPRPMMKLAVTGGGRCNITNTFEGVDSLADVYPRGDKLMKRLLHSFGPEECLRWFEERGVRFVVQDDNCVFPESQDAMQIVRTLEHEMRKGGVKFFFNRRINNIAEVSGADAVIVTTGGGTAGILAGTGIETVPHVPSLFTLKIDNGQLRSLMGTVVDNVTLGIAGTSFRSHGTLLITDWGVSGPATLRLSSYAARWLAESRYCGNLLINWLDAGESETRELLNSLAQCNSGKMIVNCHPSVLSDRLWRMLVERSGIRPGCRWAELGNKGYSKLINTLISDNYEIVGRARFKEEFVTCGGVSLKEINPGTMEARKRPGLFFAGEVLDIDAVTGGYNLQAAWSTAFVATSSVISHI